MVMEMEMYCRWNRNRDWFSRGWGAVGYCRKAVGEMGKGGIILNGVFGGRGAKDSVVRDPFDQKSRSVAKIKFCPHVQRWYMAILYTYMEAFPYHTIGFSCCQNKPV